MAYGIFNFTNENEYLNKILVLFKYRNECVEEMKVNMNVYFNKMINLMFG
jgi:hypothetical protein